MDIKLKVIKFYKKFLDNIQTCYECSLKRFFLPSKDTNYCIKNLCKRIINVIFILIISISFFSFLIKNINDKEFLFFLKEHKVEFITTFIYIILNLYFLKKFITNKGNYVISFIFIFYVFYILFIFFIISGFITNSHLTEPSKTFIIINIFIYIIMIFIILLLPEKENEIKNNTKEYIIKIFKFLISGIVITISTLIYEKYHITEELKYKNEILIKNKNINNNEIKKNILKINEINKNFKILKISENFKIFYIRNNISNLYKILKELYIDISKKKELTKIIFKNKIHTIKIDYKKNELINININDDNKHYQKSFLILYFKDGTLKNIDLTINNNNIFLKDYDLKFEEENFNKFNKKFNKLKDSLLELKKLIKHDDKITDIQLKNINIVDNIVDNIHAKIEYDNNKLDIYSFEELNYLINLLILVFYTINFLVVLSIFLTILMQPGTNDKKKIEIIEELLIYIIIIGGTYFLSIFVV